MSDITIELKAEPTRELIGDGWLDPIVRDIQKIVLDELEDKGDLYFPFDEFNIKFPTEIFLTEEQVYSDSLSRLVMSGERVTDKHKETLRKVTKDYVTKNLVLGVKLTDELGEVELTHEERGGTLFKFTFKLDETEIKVLVNDFSKNEDDFAYKMMRLIFNTIEYINKPKTEVIVSEKRERIVSKGGKKKRSKGGKRYIYKKTYRIEDMEAPDDPTREKRDYNRQMDSWKVRGHWRTYKSGKRIWIDSFKKGEGDREENKQEYRITKIQGGN